MSYECYEKSNKFEGFCEVSFKALNTKIMYSVWLISPFHFIIFLVHVLVVYLLTTYTFSRTVTQLEMSRGFGCVNCLWYGSLRRKSCTVFFFVRYRVIYISAVRGQSIKKPNFFFLIY